MLLQDQSDYIHLMVDLKCCGLVLHLQHSCYGVHSGCKRAASSLSFTLSALYLRSRVKPHPWFLCFAHHASVGACPVVVLVGAPSSHAFLLRFVYELSRRASRRQSRSEPGRTNTRHQHSTWVWLCLWSVCITVSEQVCMSTQRAGSSCVSPATAATDSQSVSVTSGKSFCFYLYSMHTDR